MNPKNTSAANSSSGDGGNLSASVDKTLHLIARQPVPDGLEERVHAVVRAHLHSSAAPQAASKAAPVAAPLLHWPPRFRPQSGWMHSAWMRAAAAAAIVALVLGGGWGILSRVQSAQPPAAAVQPPRSASSSGFSNAGAMRTPQTLNGPVVAQPGKP
jgi:hypothetical protein